MVKLKGETLRKGLCEVLQSGCIGQDGLNYAVVTNKSKLLITTQRRFVSSSFEA